MKHIVQVKGATLALDVDFQLDHPLTNWGNGSPYTPNGAAVVLERKRAVDSKSTSICRGVD